MGDNEKLRQDFDAIDTDDDGFITAAELKRSLEGNPRVSDENIATVIRLADENEDRMITLDEYTKLLG